ncbi:MAG: M20/M25/M40 family metallo-hydrolase [Bacteroidales bacterium]|jgi:hypothetical protein|nr:M20/M25/M40 family metallo-hydrolase [Bacteroidales bacterium]
MKKYKLILLFIVVPAIMVVQAQTGGDNFMKALQNINENVLKAQLGILASDNMEGRGTGTRGDYLASEYIASQLRLYGVAPGGDTSRERTSSGTFGTPEKTYFQNFPLVKSTRGETPVMKIIVPDGKEHIKTVSLAHNVDFLTRIPEQSVEIEAPVVFVGFGIRNEKLRIDDFGSQDLRGKFVLRIAGSPGFLKDKLSTTELSNSSLQAERIARQLGAAGIIEFDPDVEVSGTVPGLPFPDLAPSEKRPGSGRPYVDYSLPSAKTSDSFVRIIVSPRTADELFRGTGFNTKEYISKSASSYVKPQADLTGKKIFLKTTVNTEVVLVRNVIGIIEGKDPSQIIVAGAHYDHMGMWNGYVWNGADDNGSGTVGIMTIAKAVMETGVKPEKTIIIALWAAEEEGLLGSRHFVANLPFPASDIRLNLNFDMISRYVSEKEYNKAYMIYTDAYPVFKTMTEKHLKSYGIDLDVEYQPSADPPGGSDHRSFVDAGIPIMRFKPGHREEYHTPEDDISTVDWDIMQKIVRIGFANIWELANSEW